VDQTRKERNLVILLRIVGGVMLFAFPAIILPTAMMSDIHQWLGLGTFPDSPLIQYLARSASGMYVILGGVTIIASRDPERYQPIITYLGVVCLAFGVTLTGIDFTAGMPTYWSLGEGPTVVVIGIMILVLNRAEEP